MHWSYDSIFYHIYPLGFCGAAPQNDFCSPASPGLEKVALWLDHILKLGVNSLYLGPLFESSTHGYDTADYYRVDRRLGNNETLKNLTGLMHRSGVRVILDGVFNHTGRDFWAFKDILNRGVDSPYCNWYLNLRFDGQSPYGDPFTYEGWNGHYNLAKLNLHNPEVKQHLFGAVAQWVQEFGIDGLRLDAADCLELDFLRELSAFCLNLKPDFWLVGEVVQGDYRKWVNPGTLSAVTNYECYKGLYSSLLDANYFEIAFALNRQFGKRGIYQNLPLYNFVDNHDVDRVASKLNNPAQLYPLYSLLFTMPGVPSIYYGSEWGLKGQKLGGSDKDLRPNLDLDTFDSNNDLSQAISRLAKIRNSSPALKYGSYDQLLVKHSQLAFKRSTAEQNIVVVINSAADSVSLEIPLPGINGTYLQDLLNPEDCFPIKNGKVKLDKIWPNWSRILEVH